MRVGVPKEIKTSEFRVGLTPAVVERLTGQGHEVVVQAGAGLGVGMADEAYVRSGARIAPDAATVFESAELIVKVKEPQPAETALLRPRHILFTYLHLAANAALADGLCASGCTAIAYETVVDGRGRLPLLTPMSQVAGRMAVDVGAVHLLKPHGRGMLLGGVPGVAPAKVVILGGGVAGRHAADVALGHKADVALFEISPMVLDELAARFDGRLKTLVSTREAVEAAILDADLVIGTVLVPGASAPKLVRREHLARMKPGAVLVDVSIDQGGCFETSRPTTHDDPVFEVDGVIHYCVANMPGAAPLTSTFALCAATAPYVEALAARGLGALADDVGLAAGLNVQAGNLTHPAVAQSLRG